jgi:hypothetical protein
MSKLIEFPVKMTVKKILSEKFIDIYEKILKDGNTGEKALYDAKMELQEFVIVSMKLIPHEVDELYNSYREIKNSKELQEKAQIKFELSKCDNEVKEKYTHLLTV